MELVKDIWGVGIDPCVEICAHPVFRRSPGLPKKRQPDSRTQEDPHKRAASPSRRNSTVSNAESEASAPSGTQGKRSAVLISTLAFGC